MSERLAEIKRKANREPMGSNDDRRWLIAKVERLEQTIVSATKYACQDGMEAAAKIKLIEPAGMRRGDPTWAAGWNRGVQDFRAAIRAEIKHE